MRYFPPFCALDAFLAAAPAPADTLSSTLGGALETYQQGSELDALDQLSQAQRLLRERLASQLDSLLPPPLPGWRAGETIRHGGIPGEDMPTFTAERSYYYQDKHTVTLQLSVNSPLLPGMRLLLENPLVAEAGDVEILSVQGQPVLALLNGAGPAEELVAIIGPQSLLISAQGVEVKRKTLLDYFKQFNFQALQNGWTNAQAALPIPMLPALAPEPDSDSLSENTPPAPTNKARVLSPRFGNDLF